MTASVGVLVASLAFVIWLIYAISEAGPGRLEGDRKLLAQARAATRAIPLLGPLPPPPKCITCAGPIVYGNGTPYVFLPELEPGISLEGHPTLQLKCEHLVCGACWLRLEPDLLAVLRPHPGIADEGTT